MGGAEPERARAGTCRAARRWERAAGSCGRCAGPRRSLRCCSGLESLCKVLLRCKARGLQGALPGIGALRGNAFGSEEVGGELGREEMLRLCAVLGSCELGPGCPCRAVPSYSAGSVAGHGLAQPHFFY